MKKLISGLIILGLLFCLPVQANFTQKMLNVIAANGATSPAGNSDAFTGADDTALATHDANWGDANSTYTVANMEIISNRAQPTGNYSQGGARYTTSTSDTVQMVYIGGRSGAGGAFNACFVRGNGTVLGYSVALGGESGGNWTEAKVYKNLSNQLGTSISGSWAQASDHTIRIVASGTTTVTLTVSIDDIEIGSRQDTTDTYESGNPGFFAYPDGTMANSIFDDFQDY